MSEKNEQIKKMIEQLVQKEVRRLLPEAVKQALSGIINESVIQLPTNTSQQQGLNNSHKRRAIMEGSGPGYEDYPTMPQPQAFQQPQAYNRGMMRQNAGFEPLGMDLGNMGIPDAMNDYAPPMAPHMGMITAPAITENGTAVPVAIPDHVLGAFNTDYRGFMKAMDKHKNHG